MKLLLSYRRADSAGIAGRIYDRLAARYGRQSVFIDVDNIPLGRDFRAHIQDFINTCDVVVLVMGPRWDGPRETGAPRLHDAGDPVRIEAELALAKGVHVIPVLVEGAVMPEPGGLPESLSPLVYLNAARIDSGADFHHHVSRLLLRIDELTGDRPERARIVPRAQATLTPRVMLAAAGAMPLALALARVSPPWPPGLVLITTIVVGAALAVFLQMLNDAPVGALRRVTMIAASVLLIVSSAYPIAASLFIYETPATRERWVKGFTCTADAQALYADKCPFLGTDELKSAEYEAERLWTGGSVAAMKGTLVSLWLAGFVALAALVSALLVRQARSSTLSSQPARDPA